MHTSFRSSWWSHLCFTSAMTFFAAVLFTLNPQDDVNSGLRFDQIRFHSLLLSYFNVPTRDFGSSRTDPQGRTHNELTNIIHEPINFSRVLGIKYTPLDLLLTTNSESCSKTICRFLQQLFANTQTKGFPRNLVRRVKLTLFQCSSAAKHNPICHIITLHRQ